MWMFFFKRMEAPLAAPSLSFEAIKPYLPAGKTALSQIDVHQAVFKSIFVPLSMTPDFVESRYYPQAVYSKGEVNKRLFAMLTASRLGEHHVPGFFYPLEEPEDLMAAGAFANKFNAIIMPAIRKVLPGHPISVFAEVKKNDKGEDVLMFSPQLVISPELKGQMVQACAAGAGTLFRYEGSDAAEYTQDPLKALAQQLLDPAFVEQALKVNLMGTLTVPLFGAEPGKKPPMAAERKEKMKKFYEPFVLQFNARFAPYFAQVPLNPVSVGASIKDGKEGKHISIAFEPKIGVSPMVASLMARNGISIRA